MTERTISMVKDATATETCDVFAEAIVRAIKKGKWLFPVEQIRTVFDKTLSETNDRKAAKLAVDSLKKALPGVMWCGQFSNREKPAADKLQKHSGLLCADLDELGEKVPSVREQLQQTSRHLWVLFDSPTGDGLKAVFRVRADASKHPGSFRAVEKHVRDLTGVQVDQKCKEVARLCFLSFDPELYHNPNATELEPLPDPEKPKPTFNSSGEVNLSERQRIANEMFGDIEWDSDTHGFLTCPGKHLHTTGENEQECEIHLDGAPNIHCFHGHCKGIEAGVNHELQSQIGKAEFVPTPPAQAHPHNGEPLELPPPPPPYVPPPLDLFPNSVQRFIRAGAATFDVDRAFFLLPVLSGGAAMIGNARSIGLKEDYIEPSIIWSAYIAPTGDGKSPGLQAATAPVRMRERELIQKNKEAEKKFTEESARWDAKPKKDRAGDEKPPKPPLLTCWLDDATSEAVALRMNENPRGGLLAKDEYSHWLESMDQYHDRGGADVSRWLSIWTGNLFALDRVTGGRSYRIANPRLSITGGVVPDKFKQLLTDDFFARGLPARFLFAMPTRNQPRKWVEKSIPKEVKEAVNKLFVKLAALQPHKNEHDEEWPVVLGLTAEAQKIFVDFYNECARRAFEADIREAAQWSKLSAYSARLALVGQLMRDPDAKEISVEAMRAACKLARWFGNEAERIYALIAETPEQRADRKLVEFIQSRSGRVTERDVYTNYWPLKNKAVETKAALEKQVAAGRGEWVETKGERGPATREFQLLPASASAGFPISPSIAPKPADADVPNIQKNEPSPVTASLPVMMTKRMEADLQTMGYSQTDIDQMTPVQAHTVLAGAVPKKAPGGCDEESPTDEPNPSGGVMEL